MRRLSAQVLWREPRTPGGEGFKMSWTSAVPLSLAASTGPQVPSHALIWEPGVGGTLRNYSSPGDPTRGDGLERKGSRIRVVHKAPRPTPDSISGSSWTRTAPCPTQRPASNRSAGFGVARSQIEVMTASRVAVKPAWPRASPGNKWASPIQESSLYRRVAKIVPASATYAPELAPPS
jgi:hypothetical protein